MDEVKGYAFEGSTYCTDCAPVLDMVIVNEGDPITEADRDTYYPYGCACEECRCLILDTNDAAVDALLFSLGVR